MTTTLIDEMRERCTEFGEGWLLDHPGMEPPAGFVLDPLAIGISREPESRGGWFLLDDEWGVEAMFMDPGPAARALVYEHIERNSDIVRIELRVGPACVWAAVRATT
jgi:hypothetical protein